MFEFKCISREAFEENPHYIVFYKGESVVTIWQSLSRTKHRKIWSFVGSRDFLKYSEEFETAHKALQFIKENWTPKEEKRET